MNQHNLPISEEAPAPKGKKHHELTSAQPLRELVALCQGNASEAGRLLGLSGETVLKAIEAGQTRVVNALAAQHLISWKRSLEAPEEKPALYLLRMDAEALATLTPLFRALGITPVEIEAP